MHSWFPKKLRPEQTLFFNEVFYRTRSGMQFYNLRLTWPCPTSSGTDLLPNVPTLDTMHTTVLLLEGVDVTYARMLSCSCQLLVVHGILTYTYDIN